MDILSNQDILCTSLNTKNRLRLSIDNYSDMHMISYWNAILSCMFGIKGRNLDLTLLEVIYKIT